MQSSRVLVSVAVAVGAIGASATAQQPVRARSEISIPVKKNTTPAAPPAPREIAGTKSEVVGPPVVNVRGGEPVTGKLAPEVLAGNLVLQFVETKILRHQIGRAHV